MKSTTHTGGLHEFGDTGTIDLPYKCRYCGEYIKIENRHHHWEHECSGKARRIQKEKPEVNTEVISDDKIPKLPITPKEKDEGAIHSKILHIRGKKVDLIGKKHEDGSDWFGLTYIFRTKEDAKWVYEQTKKIKRNVLEDTGYDKNLDTIQLVNLTTQPSVRFIYNRYKKPPKEPPKRPKIKLPPKLIKVLTSILILLAIILYLTFANITEEIPENINKTKVVTVDQTLSNKISFSEYIENPYDYDKKEVTLKGFLRRSVRGEGGSGVYVESVVDDENNEIDLTNLDSELRLYFPNKGTTKEIYAVEGLFNRKYKTLEIQTKTITLTKRDPAGQIKVNKTVSYTETIIHTKTRPKYPLVRKFVFNLIGKEVKCEDGTVLDSCSENKPYYCTLYGLTEKPTACGCPKGERLYKNECILEVKCYDGTLEPECSKNKPKQCVNGKLIDNADLCGCPEGDYKKVGKSCELIKRCSDRTIYGECSSNKPLYCDNGNLIKNPKKCGCPSGTVLREEDCMDKEIVLAMESIDYLNQLREENGKKPINFDEIVYNIGMARVKDMYEYEYMDHTNPVTGSCPDNIKTKYGLSSGEYVAENAYGMWGAPASPRAAIDSWMTSRGHRYNLLYTGHTAGAVTCYGGYCVFLGLNRDRFGEGCHTGEEGTAFWETVGTQPGEV
jgi:hypothetical protein|tara:strand:- start:572 stop:2581 length:2010 start_codon:yes stop_codon:yes gene_type:complete